VCNSRSLHLITVVNIESQWLVQSFLNWCLVTFSGFILHFNTSEYNALMCCVCSTWGARLCVAGFSLWHVVSSSFFWLAVAFCCYLITVLTRVNEPAWRSNCHPSDVWCSMKKERHEGSGVLSLVEFVHWVSFNAVTPLSGWKKGIFTF